jgi:hypothetical protein
MPFHQHTPPPRRGRRAKAKVAIAGTLNDRFCSSLIIFFALRPQVPNPTVSWIDSLNAKRESTLHGTETMPMISVFGLYSVCLIYEFRQAGGARNRLCSNRYRKGKKKANGVYHRRCTAVISQSPNTYTQNAQRNRQAFDGKTGCEPTISTNRTGKENINASTIHVPRHDGISSITPSAPAPSPPGASPTPFTSIESTSFSSGRVLASSVVA